MHLIGISTKKRFNEVSSFIGSCDKAYLVVDCSSNWFEYSVGQYHLSGTVAGVEIEDGSRL